MPEITIDKYAPDVYAEKRVQEMAFVEDTLTVNFATEDRSAAHVYDATMTAADLLKAKEAGLEPGLTRPTEAVLERAEGEFTLIRDDAARSADDRASADILSKKARDEKEMMLKERLKQPYRFSKSVEMFRSMTLSVKPDPESEEGKKIERYSKHYEDFTTYLSNRFSTTNQFSDRLKTKDEGASKELAGPVEKKVKYSDIPE